MQTTPPQSHRKEDSICDEAQAEHRREPASRPRPDATEQLPGPTARKLSMSQEIALQSRHGKLAYRPECTELSVEIT